MIVLSPLARAAPAPGGNTGDAVGSVEAADFASHAHPFVTGPESAPHTHSGTTAADGGGETRPVNMALNWIIKF